MAVDHILFLIIWAFQIPIWIYMLSLAGYNILGVGVVPFHFLFMLLFQYFGFPILFFDLDRFWTLNDVLDKMILLELFAYTSAGMFLFLSGIYLARFVFNHKGKIFYSRHLQIKNNLRERILIGFLIVSGVASVFIYVRLVGLDNVAILTVLNLSSGGSQHLQRSLMTNDFAGSLYRYELFMYEFLQIGFFSLFFLYCKGFYKSYFSKLLLFLLFLFVCFVLIMATIKGPIIMFMIILFYLRALANEKTEIKISTIIKICFASFLLIIPMNMMIMEDTSIIRAILGALSRITTGQMQAAYHHLEFFPEHQEFLFGRSLPNPGGFMSYDPYLLSEEVKRFVEPEVFEQGIRGSAPTVYWMEMYANFQLLIAMVSCVIVGFLLYFLDRILVKFNISALTAGLVGWLMLHYSLMFGTALSAFVIDTKVVAVVLLFVLTKLTLRRS